jgi:hypothetical protein
MSIELGQLEASLGKPYWEKTPEETACGRCDIDAAGEGAAVVSDPEKGLIVACRNCRKAIKVEAELRAATPEPDPVAA